jgi:hypothetical protein
MAVMSRDGAIIFGKLDMPRIECPKCGRAGRYRLVDLITRYAVTKGFSHSQPT